MPKKEPAKKQDKKLQQTLEHKLAKFKKTSIHDRLTGENTSNITSKVDDIDTSKIKSKNTSNVNSNDKIDVISDVTGKNNINDVSNITSKVTIDDTDNIKSDFTSKDRSKININDAVNIESKVDDVDTIDVKSQITSNDNDQFNNVPIPEPPKLAREAKKAVTFYLDKNVHARFEQYVKDQIKTKKLRSSKVKSYYAEAAIDFFLKSQGY
ncbi:hypothetical protein [Thermoactinomyces vulgaris]|uniref:hypothetical protein n=1 Tax=Thermoactinomyces vulgaris TaxID=2026 RepID=UPI00363C2D07